MRRVLRQALMVKAALLVLAVIVVGAGYLRLAVGPMRFEGLSDQVTAALAARLGDRWRVTLNDTAIGLEGGALALKVAGLDIRNPEGVLVARAPQAVVSVDAFSILSGDPLPRAIEFHDVQLRARIARDGTLSIVPSGEAPAPPQDSAAATAVPPPPSLALAMSSLFDFLLDPTSPVGALDRASAVNTRLTLVDEAGRERVGFARVDARFDRQGARRQFAVSLDGPGGPWRVEGDVGTVADGGRDASVTVTDMPVHDLVLLAGLSSLTGSDDLTLSGAARVSIGPQAKVRGFEATLASNTGRLTIDDPDLPWVPVERLAVETAWDAARSVLELRTVEYKAGATRVRLSGELAEGDGHDWRLTLAGKDARLAGAVPGDEPFTIGAIAVNAHGGLNGVVVDSITLSGPDLDVSAALSFGRPEDQGGLRAGVRARNVPVRAALRLWPTLAAPIPRTYLVENLRAGMARDVSVAVVITAQNLADMKADRGLPPEAVKVSFDVTDGVLRVADGLPNLSEAHVKGTVTGTSAMIEAETGRVAMPDGRALDFRAGTFALPDFWRDDAVAAIDFKLEGGADALASFLRVPALKEVSGFVQDPAGLGGRADLKVHVPLTINAIPNVADVPISVTGKLSDLTLDRIVGRERLEAGTLAVSFDKGSLSLKGEGRIGGTPANVEVRQPRGSAGEAQVTLVLDDAARAKRGLAVAPHLAGNVPVKIVAPLGPDAKGGIRIEADLARASVADLVPGWVKPSGRPGKLTLTLVDGERLEARDIVLDSGPVQMRGNATLSDKGDLERAEFGTFKLSPGDDVRVQAERGDGALKVVVRGNTLDARPFLKSIGGVAGGQKDGGRGDATDVDLSVNILTGFNEEAVTKAALTLALRTGDLRDVSFSARFPSSPVSAQIVKGEGGGPVLVVQSADAGAFLRFTDVYRRMAGGELIFQMALGGERQPGNLAIRDFELRDEPALRRIASQQPVPSGPDDARGQARPPPINASVARFEKAKADFVRTAARLDFRDAVMWGTQVGFKLDGWLDYARDRVDIQGTFVPAYGLNNVFAQVPLFGPLLGGGQYEGLFAVNFRVSGSASAPTLTINPLSAIAPGFLRKLFGASASNPTGVPPPALPER